MQEKLDIIIENINNNPNWSQNVKIRYAYIELGKIIHKNVNFFYTLYNKLGDKNLKTPELNEILSNKFNESVICRTSAEMLKYIFDNTGISSKIIKTISEEKYQDEYGTTIINHYFLSAQGDDNKNYFLTLTADLHNIQAGFKTEHFAGNIPYRDKNGQQIYEGEEIKNFPMSAKEIEFLDQQIGYSNDKYQQLYTDDLFRIINNAYYTNNYYLNILSKQTDFYYDLISLINGSESEETECINVELFKVKEETWNIVKKFVYYTSMKKIFFDNEIELSVDEIQELTNLLNSNNFNEFNILLKEKLKNIPFKTKIDIFNPRAVLNKINEFVEDIDNIKNLSRDNSEEIKIFKEKFEFDMNKICSYFIESKYLPPKNKRFTSEYIAHKIIVAFHQIFDFGNITSFNSMKVGEQSTIIGKILEIILKELEPKKHNPNYDSKKSPVKNRIITSVIIDKETNEYKYLMYITNDNYASDGNYDNGITLIFDLKNNYIISDVGLGEIFLNYYVITDRISIKIEDIESEEPIPTTTSKVHSK